MLQDSVDYHAAGHPKTNSAVLNASHNYFLLADNGTEGKYGADFMLRKKLEKFISQQRIHTSKLSSAIIPALPAASIVMSRLLKLML